MKNSEKQTEKAKKPDFFKKATSKLKEKDEIEVKSRLSAVVDFLLTATVAYLAGGAQLFFSTFPICIALLCSSKKRLLPIGLGLSLLAVTKGLPSAYLFSCIAVLFPTPW